MNMTFDNEQTTLGHTLDQVISQHGRVRVFGALLLRLISPARARHDQRVPMNAYLRRDIGLLPMDHRIDAVPPFGGLMR
jgi:hypothetical protein